MPTTTVDVKKRGTSSPLRRISRSSSPRRRKAPPKKPRKKMPPKPSKSQQKQQQQQQLQTTATVVVNTSQKDNTHNNHSMGFLSSLRRAPSRTRSAFKLKKTSPLLLQVDQEYEERQQHEPNVLLSKEDIVQLVSTGTGQQPQQEQDEETRQDDLGIISKENDNNKHATKINNIKSLDDHDDDDDDDRVPLLPTGLLPRDQVTHQILERVDTETGEVCLLSNEAVGVQGAPTTSNTLLTMDPLSATTGWDDLTANTPQPEKGVSDQEPHTFPAFQQEDKVEEKEQESTTTGLQSQLSGNENKDSLDGVHGNENINVANVDNDQDKASPEPILEFATFPQNSILEKTSATATTNQESNELVRQKETIESFQPFEPFGGGGSYDSSLAKQPRLVFTMSSFSDAMNDWHRGKDRHDHDEDDDNDDDDESLFNDESVADHSTASSSAFESHGDLEILQSVSSIHEKIQALTGGAKETTEATKTTSKEEEGTIAEKEEEGTTWDYWMVGCAHPGPTHTNTLEKTNHDMGKNPEVAAQSLIALNTKSTGDSDTVYLDQAAEDKTAPNVVEA